MINPILNTTNNKFTTPAFKGGCQTISANERKIIQALNMAINNGEILSSRELAERTELDLNYVRQLIYKSTNPVFRELFEKVKNRTTLGNPFERCMNKVTEMIDITLSKGITKSNDPTPLDIDLDDYTQALVKSIVKLKLREESEEFLLNSFTSNPVLIDSIIGSVSSSGERRIISVSGIKSLMDRYKTNPDLILDLLKAEDAEGKYKYNYTNIAQIVDILNEAPELEDCIKEKLQLVKILYDSENSYSRPRFSIDEIQNLAATESKNPELFNVLMKAKIDTVDGLDYKFTGNQIVYIMNNSNAENDKLVLDLLNYTHHSMYYSMNLSGDDIVSILKASKSTKQRNLLNSILQGTALPVILSKQGFVTFVTTAPASNFYFFKSLRNKNFTEDEIIKLAKFTGKILSEEDIKQLTQLKTTGWYGDEYPAFNESRLRKEFLTLS